MNTDTLNQRQQEVVDEFAFFDEWMDKYEHIIELGKELPELPMSETTDDQLIKGCQSRVWLDASLAEDGTVRYRANSDAIITKGMVSLMVRVLDGLSPETVVDAELWFLDQIGLKEHLSPTRANGLLAMVKQMKFYGLAFQAQRP
jgi:cysteine desulfuration protein SufE